MLRVVAGSPALEIFYEPSPDQIRSFLDRLARADARGEILWI